LTHTNTIVIGASAAGLAMAACLKKRNIPFILLEKGSEVGAAWRHHYDRLHLHTNKGASALPYFKFPSNYPKYPARDEVVRYLELYKAHFELKLVFGCEVKKVSRDDGKWKVLTTCGAFGSEHVVVCTGYTRKPNIPHWPGMEDFTGKILHSAAYKNGSAFRNQKVLVVGFGNSACEIAICLHEHNALPSLSVRGTVNNLPKEILGIPVLGIGIALSILPPKLADLIGKPAVRMTVGNPEKYGLKEAPYEPIEQIVRELESPQMHEGLINANEKLKRHPSLLNSDPLTDGWVYSIETSNWAKDLRVFLLGEEYITWLKSEFTRLKDFLSFKVKPHSQHEFQVVMQEGGELKDGILEHFGPEVWEEFQAGFINNSR